MTKATESKALPVMNHEAEVSDFRTKLFFFAQLTEEISSWKERFRGYADQAAQGVANVTSLHFLDGKGGHIQVTRPDEAKDGNRTLLTGPKIKIAADAGIDLSDPSMTEVSRSITLTGEWLTWIDGVRAQWATGGIVEPAGLTERTDTKLSMTGIQKLRTLALQGVVAAGELLKAAIKSGSVSAK